MISWVQWKELLSKEWEFIKMVASFLPISGCKLFTAFVTILFAGTLSQAHLDGVGLANTLLNVVVLSLSLGYTSVFDTYGPQVNASQGPRELVTVLVKCLLQGALVHLAILGPYLNLVYVIDVLPESDLSVGSEGKGNFEIEDFRDIAIKYLRITFFAEYLEYAACLMSKYFAVKGKKRNIYIITSVMAIVHVLANYVFVSVLELREEGLGLALLTGRIATLIVAAGFCIADVKNGSRPWKGFTLNILIGWKPMIKLGLSGALNIFAEVAILEVATFLSQFVNTASLSVIIILFQLLCLGWIFTRSISHSGATLIGKALAGCSAKDVQQYMILTSVNTLLEVCPLAMISYVFRENLVQIFEDNPEVVDLFTSTFWLVSVSLIVNHCQITLNQGMLIAFGHQRFVALSTSISCTVIGLPIIIATIFLTDLGVLGIFLGWIIADALILIAGLIKILTTDINKEIEKSRVRVAESLDASNSNLVQAKSDDRENDYLLMAEQKQGGPKDKESGKWIKKSSYMEGDSQQMLVETGSADDMKTPREAKTVLFTFLFFTVSCACLAGVSFLRD